MSAVVICLPRTFAAVRKSIRLSAGYVDNFCLHTILQAAGLTNKADVPDSPGRECPIHPPDTKRPEGRRLTKAALLDGAGQEDWSARCLTTRRIPRPPPRSPPRPSPTRSAAAGGRCAIRTPSWCASPCTGRARERWCGGSPRERQQPGNPCTAAAGVIPHGCRDSSHIGQGLGGVPLLLPG